MVFSFSICFSTFERKFGYETVKILGLRYLSVSHKKGVRLIYKIYSDLGRSLLIGNITDLFKQLLYF